MQFMPMLPLSTYQMLQRHGGVVIMIITLAVYGFAPMGFERKKISGTVQTTNLAHEEVSMI